MIITTKAHARAGLVGNPSDGYFGKTISFVIRNFAATVTLWESPHFEIIPSDGDFAKFRSVNDFLRDVKLYGYYGGLRLMKATVRKFHLYCQKNDIELHERNFTLQFQSDIPRLVGMSGSSAIVIATLRALQQFYNVQVPKHLLPSLALSVEREELNITAGMQDRVIQTYEGIVYMDFDRKLMETRGYGEYEQLRPNPAPPLYVAYDPDRAEVSDVPHRNLRALWDKGDPTVVAAMQKLRDLTDRGHKALGSGDWGELGKVVDENFEVRRTIMNIAPENQRMVDVARSVGCSAHFAGSGGAVCGLFSSGTQYQNLVDAMAEIRCTVIRPLVFDP